MDKLLKKPTEEIVGIFEEASARLNLMPYIIEKDFWVCWILKRLYSMPECMPIIFKRGTSLSKAYGLIERFSEDVDLTIDRLILENIEDPTEKDISRKELSRRVKTLVNAAESYVDERLMPMLYDVIRNTLKSEFNWKLEVGDDKQTILSITRNY